MFDSLDRIFSALFYTGLAVLLGYGLWQLGFWPMLVSLAFVGLLTWHRLWLPVLLGVFLGLR